MKNLSFIIWIFFSAFVNVGLALFFGGWVPLVAYIFEVASTLAYLFSNYGIDSKIFGVGFFVAISIAMVSWLLGAGIGYFL